MRAIQLKGILAIFLGVAMAALPSMGMAAPVATLLGFSSADFEIRDPANGMVIGHARYSVTKEGAEIALHGDDRYTSGEYDFEHDKFETLPGALPVLVSADHYFFLANGAPEFQSNYDLKSGLATCMDFRGQPPVTQTVQLSPTAGTWAGASVMVPIQDFLRRGGTGTLSTHVFNCAPSPKVFAVKVSITDPQTPAPLARTEAVEVELKPDFGWLNLFMAPFVPHLNAWFDPTHNWDFVGAALARFYQGPNILLARIAAPAATADATRQAPLK